MPGYRKIPATDVTEQKLRDQWYATQGAEREAVNTELVKYLWERVEKQVTEDRKRHPRAKRNLPVGSERKTGKGRTLP